MLSEKEMDYASPTFHTPGGGGSKLSHGYEVLVELRNFRRATSLPDCYEVSVPDGSTWMRV